MGEISEIPDVVEGPLEKGLEKEPNHVDLDTPETKPTRGGHNTLGEVTAEISAEWEAEEAESAARDAEELKKAKEEINKLYESGSYNPKPGDLDAMRRIARDDREIKK